MCGRFVLTTDAKTLGRLFGLALGDLELLPDDDVRPGEKILSLRRVRGARGTTADRLKWGFTLGERRFVINARLETAHEKAAFRDALAQTRCLIPADGWYEWPEKGGPPTLLTAADGRPLALAGLVREPPPLPGGRQAPAEVVILTTAARPELARIHDRMPALLPPESQEAWLDPRVRDVRGLRSLIAAPDELPVATRVVAPLPAKKR